MKAHVVQETVTDRLTDQIGSLQEAFRRLSRAATLKDQAEQFLSVVGRYFDGDTIALFLRRSPSAVWQRLAGTIPVESTEVLGPGGSSDEAARFVEVGAARITIVHRLVDKSQLGIVLVRTSAGAPYTDVDGLSLRLFVSLIDSAYQDLLARRNEKELIFSLNHRVLQLNSLIDTGIEVAKLTNDVQPHHLALERAASLCNASKGRLHVTGESGVTETNSFPEGDSSPPTSLAERRILSEFQYGGNSYTFELFDKESRGGIIAFEDTDQLLLDALARQVQASLENRYLHRQALEKQKIEQDIAVAAAIQQRILPKALPRIDGYDVSGINIPSKSVGGDYYDCIPLAGGRYALVIADVAGKGVPAALLVSSFHAYLSAYLEGPLPLVELVGKLNRVICHASTEDKFITAFLGILDPATGALETVNAGHNPVFLLRRAGGVEELALGGVPLGMLDIDFPYQRESVTIEPGDRLLLYTDGITEATNVRDQLYDYSTPLKEFFRTHRPSAAEGFIRELIEDVKKFTGEAPQNDDITALYLGRS